MRNFNFKYMQNGLFEIHLGNISLGTYITPELVEDIRDGLDKSVLEPILIFMVGELNNTLKNNNMRELSDYEKLQIFKKVCEL